MVALQKWKFYSTKKRTRELENWKKSMAKAKRARGEEYGWPTAGKTIPVCKVGPSANVKEMLRTKYFLTVKELKFLMAWQTKRFWSHIYLIKRRRAQKTPRRATQKKAKICTLMPQFMVNVWTVKWVPVNFFACIVTVQINYFAHLDVYCYNFKSTHQIWSQLWHFIGFFSFWTAKMS